MTMASTLVLNSKLESECITKMDGLTTLSLALVMHVLRVYLLTSTYRRMMSPKTQSL
jgi:hypothetical protein